MHYSKKFAYVIGSIRERPLVKEFLARRHPHAAIFHHSRITAACGIYGKAVYDNLGKRLIVYYRAIACARNDASQQVHLLRGIATESGNSLLLGSKTLILGIRKTLHL